MMSFHAPAQHNAVRALSFLVGSTSRQTVPKCGTAPQGAAPRRAVVLVARPPVGEVTAHPPPGSPRSLGAARYSVVERKNFLSYTTRKVEQMETAITNFFGAPGRYSLSLDGPNIRARRSPFLHRRRTYGIRPHSGGSAGPAVEQQRVPGLCHLRDGKLRVCSRGHPARGGLERKNFLSYTTRKVEQMETAITNFFADIFSCSPVR